MIPDRGGQRASEIARLKVSEPFHDDATLAGWMRQRRARFEALRQRAFGNIPDPLAAYGEGFLLAADQQIEMTVQMLKASENRTSANLVVFADELTTIASRCVAQHPVADGFGHDGPSLQADGVVSRYRFFMATGAAILCCFFGAGVLVEHWRMAAGNAGPALAAIARLQLSAATASANLTAASGVLHDALGEAYGGISIINRVAALPQREREEFSRILVELESNPGSETVLQLAALLALPNATRDAALSFAERGTPALREELIAIENLTVARSARGDSLHSACLTGGPVYRNSKEVISTCLVQVPNEWGETDAKLREFYRGNWR